MTDMDGEYAFDRLLEKYGEAVVEAKRSEEKYQVTYQKTYAAEQERDKALREVVQLEAKQKASLPRLAELWGAGDAAIDALAIGSLRSDDEIAATKERLRKALEAAGPDCDQVPF